jgi:hypothetical protein
MSSAFFKDLIEKNSSRLKSNRTTNGSATVASWSSTRSPFSVAEVNENDQQQQQTPLSSSASTTPPSSTSNRLLLQDVSAVKSAVVQVAAEVGRHAQTTIETKGTIQRLGDDQNAIHEVIQTLRQRVVQQETQLTQQAAVSSELKRMCGSLRQQYAHLQSSINERATRGEVSASISATIGPVRAQVESALQHYSEGLATATATAAAAVHAANDAKRRVISQRVTSTAMSFHPMAGDPEFSMSGGGGSGGSGSGGSGGSGINESMSSNTNNEHHQQHHRGLGQHETLMNSIDIIEARVERRMLRSIEDKIELEMSRATERGDALNFGSMQNDGRDSRNSTTNSSSDIVSAVFKEWQLDLEGKVQECFQRVLEMGGKLAEESQRRHLAISAARAETRMEGKRIDELSATVSVAEQEMRETTSAAALTTTTTTSAAPAPVVAANIAALLGSSTGTVTVTTAAKTENKEVLGVVHKALRDFVTSNTFTESVQQIIETEVERRVRIAVDEAVMKLATHFDSTVAKLEKSTVDRQTSFEQQWSSKFDAGMETNDSEMEEIRDDHEKMQHDVKALRKMILEQKKILANNSTTTTGTTTHNDVTSDNSNTNGSGTSTMTMDPDAMIAMKRANAAQIQRAQNRFDRQLQELRTDLSSKHATHDRVLAKIEESVNRAMALTLKASSGSNSSSGGIKGAIKPPTKPRGPPPPNAKRAPPPTYGSSISTNNSSNSSNTMKATAALRQASLEVDEEASISPSSAAATMNAELKFQDDVKRTRAMLDQQKKKSRSSSSSITSGTSDAAPVAPSVTSSLLAPPLISNNGKAVSSSSSQASSSSSGANKKTMKKAMEERQQCPFCLKRFEADVLVNHKINCDCRTVHCQFCGKGRMARQLKTHEQFCDQNPKNSSKSEKKKCKHCDKYFSAPQLAAHRCDWEPRQCRHCGMQIIARDIGRHEEKCASKKSKKRSLAKGTEDVQEEEEAAEGQRCCSFGA